MYNHFMESQSWLEVSLTVRPELAEAVAEVLSRFAPGGVAVESTAIQAGADEFGDVTGDLLVRAYLPVDSQIEDTRQRLIQSLHYLGMIEPLPEPAFKLIHDQNWMEAWKKHYRPVEVGQRLLVLPVWIEIPDSGRIPLRIDPGMAFGTGTHPTTQLSLALLEDYLQPDAPVLDIGCGTGILSVAARLLGASAAYGVDVDEKSVAISRRTAADNQVFEGITFEHGSVKEVQDGIFPIRQAPVVVANILAHILICLLDDGMAGLIVPGGVLLLSGILEEKLPEMQAALDKHGLGIIEQRRIEDWIGLAVEHLS
jgi:ribosomal protein L11 methyltransferase